MNTSLSSWSSLIATSIALKALSCPLMSKWSRKGLPLAVRPWRMRLRVSPRVSVFPSMAFEL